MSGARPRYRDKIPACVAAHLGDADLLWPTTEQRLARIILGVASLGRSTGTAASGTLSTYSTCMISEVREDARRRRISSRRP